MRRFLARLTCLLLGHRKAISGWVSDGGDAIMASRGEKEGKYTDDWALYRCRRCREFAVISEPHSEDSLPSQMFKLGPFAQDWKEGDSLTIELGPLGGKDG